MTPHVTFNDPPIDAVMPATAQTWMAVLFGAAALVALGFGAVVFVRRRDPIPLLIVLAGGLSFFLEPEFAVLSQKWYPRHGSWEIFTVYDRAFPVFQFLAAVAVVGGMTAYAYVLLGRDSRPAAVWRLFIVESLILTVLEIAPVAAGTSIWFGLHPTAAFDVPLWVPISKAATSIGVAALIRVARPRLREPHRFLLIPLFPVVFAGLHAAVCWPVWVALGARWGTVANLAAAFAVIGLSLLTVHVVDTGSARYLQVDIRDRTDKHRRAQDLLNRTG